MTEEEMDQIKELSSIRYVFSFVLEELGLDQLKEDFEGHDIPDELLDTTQRIHKVLVALYSELKKLDADQCVRL